MKTKVNNSQIPGSEAVGNEALWQQIYDGLKDKLPEYAIMTWVDYFSIGKHNGTKITVWYSGKASLKKFKELYWQIFCSEVCNVLMLPVDIKIRKRSAKAVQSHISPAKDMPEAEEVFQEVTRPVKSGIMLSFMSVICAAAALCIAVLVISHVENMSFDENFVSVSSAKIYEPFRIIQISDLHGSQYGKGNKKLISRIEKLKPDIVAITGDMMDTSGGKEAALELCAALSDIAPTYYVYGNNEEMIAFDGNTMTLESLDDTLGFDDSNRNPEKLLSMDSGLKKEIERSGVTVLCNSYDSIKIGSNDVDIYGVLTANPSAFWPYAGESYGKFLYEDNPSSFKLLLTHEPLIFSYLEKQHWGDLALAGDTHGGLLRLPLVGAVYARGAGILPERKEGNYIKGLYKAGDTPLFVSSGLSGSELLRINNKPELVILDVNRY